MFSCLVRNDKEGGRLLLKQLLTTIALVTALPCTYLLSLDKACPGNSDLYGPLVEIQNGNHIVQRSGLFTETYIYQDFFDPSKTCI